ncbi:eCIS core domain-containing protein [Georgenia sp. Marseille-Q6866]
MREHDQRDPAGEPSTRTSRPAAPEPHLLRAAAAHRPDVLGAEGLLGLQRLVGNEATGEVLQERSPVLDVVGSGGGQALEPDVRTDMEARLGADFTDVRVHSGGAASDSARAVGAHAYTVGSDVVFQRYDPSSTAGRTMLAHELTHVVQQRTGPVDGSDTGTGVRVSDPGDRFEREAASTAEAVMSGPAPAPVQRQEDEEELQGAFVERQEDEEELQGAFVQRQDDEEELQGAFVQRDEVEEEVPGAAPG